MPIVIKDAYHCTLTQENIESALEKKVLSPLQGVSALPESSMEPHDARLISVGYVLSDKVSKIGYIAGVALQAKEESS